MYYTPEMIDAWQKDMEKAAADKKEAQEKLVGEPLSIPTGNSRQGPWMDPRWNKDE